MKYQRNHRTITTLYELDNPMANPFESAQLASNIAFTAARKAPKTAVLQQPKAQATSSTPKKSIVEFWDSIKQKHPEYNDMDSAELGRRMLTKYPEYNDLVEQPQMQSKPATIDALTTAWVWAGAVAWLVGGWKIAWDATAKLWKFIYWLTLPPIQADAEALQSYEAWTSNYKPKTAVETALEAPMVQKWGRTLESKVWMMWTREQIGTQAEARANEIRKDTVQPLLKKSKTTINVQWAIKELWSEIEKIARKDPDKLAEYKEAFKQLQESFADKSYGSMKLEDLQTLKSWLQSRTPQKFFKGQEITNAYQELRGLLSGKLVGKLHSALKKDYGVKSSEMYRDYANLMWLSEIWPKARTQAGRKWWSGWLLSWIMEHFLTPITTTTWKAMYKAWKWAGVPYWKATDIIKNLWKWVAKWWKLFSLIGDWSLIPWTPSNIVSEALNASTKDYVEIKNWPLKWYSVKKNKMKYNELLWKKVVDTDIGYIDENGNVIN